MNTMTITSDTKSTVERIERELGAMNINEIIREIDTNLPGFAAALAAMIRGQTALRANEIPRGSGGASATSSQVLLRRSR